MDTSIRNLLVLAQKQSGIEKNPSLLQAYGLLRNVAETRPAVDAPEPFGPDLYVLCAEIAFQNGSPDMARECLKMFFMKPPPANQFLCRAYLCQAQLLAPQDANSPEKLEKAVVYLLKAISFAKKNQRYHFLVYNASVLYWQFCRPFLKPNYRQYLARSLHQVVKALDDIDDKDYEWRAQLMIALIECHLDAGRRSDASHIAAAAVTFIKQNVPSLHKQVFGLMVRHQLVESTKFHRDLKNSPELSIYYKICKIKVSLENGEQKEYYSEIQSIMNQMGVPYMSSRPTRYDKVSVSSRPRSPSMSPTGKEEDVPKDSFSDDEDIIDLTALSLYHTNMKKSPGKGGRRTPTPTTSKKIPVDSADKPYLLLELGRLCLDLDFADLGESCVEHTKTCVVKEQGFYLELEFLQCELMVKLMGDKQESYHKSAIDVRQHAIKRCEESIMNAIRQGDPNIVQAGCVTQWNLCLPLLQSNLRQSVRKPLTLLAEALEDVQSLLIQLRCQVHTELAKCEEDREQIQVAMEHLRKALGLDDGGVYRERLEVSLHRLELRSELYKTPERPEDQAAMIIEQARTADSGTMRMKRSLLVKAGEALAPDAFLLVLDSESDTKDVAGGKGPLTVIRQLAGKARQFSKCVKKAEGHLKRLGNENERERARLWADLAKTARKQEVWDVCRVAARFCLLYDDGRWKNAPPVKAESPKLERSRTAERESRDEAPVTEKSSSRMGSRPATPVARVALYDKDLIRILAEINFIQGEAMIHLLRGEGVQLNDQPIPPEDKSKHPKGYVPKKPEEDPEWIEYCDWINSLSESSTDSFLRGLTLGVELIEPWLVCSAAAYVWNYNNHVFTQDRHREVINTLTAVLDGLKAVGHAGETVMLANICNALATGLMKPWMPEPPPRDSLEASPSPSPGDKSPSKKGKSAVAGGSGKSKSPYIVTISPDAMPDLKKAIEVCEYAMQVTNGDNHNDVVPISVRLPLLQTWVFVKQMAQIQINKNLGTEDDHNTEGQKPMTRAIVATEMMCLSKNGIMEFKETPFIGDIVQMVDGCSWTDKFVELQLWSRLTYQAFLAKLHNLVMKCSKQALKFANVGTTPKGKKVEAHRYMVEQEMLSYSSGLQGQSLMENMGGKNALRREAMEAFLNSSRFARNANNYELVMTAARHHWNACIPLVGQPIERELLKEPIRVILQCITATAEKTQKKEDKSDQKEESPGKKEVAVKTEETKDVAATAEVKKASMIGNPEEDLTLRAALYGVLFQSYADKGEWELALQSMDQAINDMPRTKHRLLIFKHRVMVKAKLGRAVHMDIQKFKDESEDYVAHMWRRVALSSKEKSEQMSSYQYAVEALSSPSSEWQKVDYLIEFGQWLYVNDFPLPDAIDQIEWAIDILLNMKSGVTAESQKKDEKGGLKGEAKKGQMKAKREKKKPGKGSARPKGGSVGRKSPDAGKKTPDNMSKASDARSDVSDSESEINPADYIPVIKQAEIGVLAANPGLTLSELTDISQLDALIRTHVILAEIHGRNSQCYTDICLMAHGYLMQLWKVCMSSVGPVMKEIAKNPSDTTVAGKKSANTKKDPKKDKEVTKEKPKRKGPLDSLPSSTEEWAVYDVPDEALEAFKHETMKKTGITADTLQKPMLTLYCLDVLTKILHDIGFTHLTLPVLAFQDLMSRGLLHNNALHVLVHVRSMEVCQELDLKTGASFHEKIISPIVISEDDQARSREEIAVMKEKQTQVAREEMRVKATLAQLGDETAVKKRGQTPGFQSIKLDEIVETESHLGKVLGAVTFQEIWADTAEVLIRQGLYPRARQFLNEAMIAAKEFKDAALEAKILFLLAKLSFEESQYGQAINLCKMAQDLHSGDEVFWYDTTVLMIDATMCDYENRQARRAAKKILIHSLNEFSKIYDERPNRMSITGYILADLEGRLASVQADILLKEHKNVNNPQIMKGVLSSCEKFENATENLIRLSYKREALPLMKKHAAVLRHLAREAIEKDLAHMYYLQSVLVLKDASALAEEIHHDSQTLFSLQETRNLSLPVQRELVDLEIELGAVLTEVLHVQAKEARLQQLDDQRKGSVLKMVEDLIRQTPTYTHMEREWEESKQNCGEEAISSLLSAHSLSGNIPHLRARSLCQLGKCLSILSQHSGPDPPPQWLVHEMELLRVNTGGGEEGEEEEHKGEEEDQGVVNKHLHKYTKQIKTMKHQHEVSKLYLSLATECLTQCLNLCLTKKYIDLAGLASLELVDCFGQFDPGTASNFLALYQSCAASQAFKSVLCRSQLDPVTSRLAALLNQRERLVSRDVQTNLSNSPLMVSVNTSLEDDWQAWKKIEVMPNHVELLREFPPNFNFVVLQHSPDKTFLYGALLDKLGKATTGGGKSNPKQIAAAKAAASSAPSKARVYGMETSPRQLEDLISKFRQHKQSVQQMLLKQEYQRTQAAQRTRMLENLDQDMKGLESKPQTEGEAAREVERLQEEFRALVAAMDDYLKPIMAPIETAFRAIQSPQSNINVGKDAKVEPTPSQECVVVLADLDLLEMPLEALECLKSDNIFSLSRDFSLQLFYHRFHQEQPPAEEGGDKKKKKADASQIVSRIPGAREAKQKQAKIIPLDRKPEPWQLAVDTMNFKYIVDPNVDCSETEEHKPLHQFNKVLEEYEQQFTPRWLGLTGQEHMPSVGEWEIYISEGSSFLFYGMERFLSYLPPSKISALNIPECMMVYSLDMSQTSKSFLRQSKVDVLKSHNNLALEKPVESAMLVSMSGVKCVLANQWHCTLAENSDRFNLTIKDLLEKGKTTGETVRLLFSPKKRKQEEDKAQSELEGRADSVATGSQKGEGAGQKGGDTNRSKDSESQKGGKSRPESKEETKEGEEDPDKDKEEPKEPEEMILQRDWFNMVCYGLPNLIITHV